MRPAVVRDFVAGIDHRFHCIGKSFDRVARHVPRRRDAVLPKEREEPRRADSRTEFAARKPSRRPLIARYEAGDRIEIEREADDVFGHCLKIIAGREPPPSQPSP